MCRARKKKTLKTKNLKTYYKKIRFSALLPSHLYRSTQASVTVRFFQQHTTALVADNTRIEAPWRSLYTHCDRCACHLTEQNKGPRWVLTCVALLHWHVAILRPYPCSPRSFGLGIDHKALLLCALSLAAHCIVFGPVCGFVCVWVCYHDNTKTVMLILVLVLVLKDSLRTKFKSLSFSLSLQV